MSEKPTALWHDDVADATVPSLCKLNRELRNLVQSANDLHTQMIGFMAPVSNVIRVSANGGDYTALTVALEALPRWLPEDITITVAGTLDEDVLIEGFCGPGRLIISLPAGRLTGKVTVQNNIARIQLCGTLANPGTLYCRRAGSAPLNLSNNLHLEIRYLVVEEGLLNTCALSIDGGQTMLQGVTVKGGTGVCIRLQSGTLRVQSCIFSGPAQWLTANFSSVHLDTATGKTAQLVATQLCVN